MAARCFLSHGNSVEINLLVLDMQINTFFTKFNLFLFAMKHCKHTGMAILLEDAYCDIDVKKMTPFLN